MLYQKHQVLDKRKTLSVETDMGKSLLTPQSTSEAISLTLISGQTTGGLTRYIGKQITTQVV